MRMSARLWPIAIVGVLAVTVAANLVLLWAASDHDAGAVESDYYRKGVAWDSTLALREHSATLGWRLDARLGAVGPTGAPLSAAIVDAQGRTLSGALVTVEAIHNAFASTPLVARLRERRAGDYETMLPAPRAGLWELRFDVVRGADHFVVTVRRDAAAS